MQDLDRRELLKLAGGGAGVVIASSFFADRLLAGSVPASGMEMLQGRFGVTKEVMKKVLEAALSKGGDFAELFFEYALNNNVVMEDDIIRESSEDVTLGVGIRVLNGKQTGYAYTSDLSPETMRRAALTAAAIASSGARSVRGDQGGPAGPAGVPDDEPVRRRPAGGPDHAGQGGLRGGEGTRPAHQQGGREPRRLAAVRDHRQQRRADGVRRAAAGAAAGERDRRGERQAGHGLATREAASG